MTLPNRMEVVLVTGGTGFVAGWCIVELLQRGYEVRTTVRDPAKESAVRAAVASSAGAADRLTFFAADLTADDGWDDAMAGCDYVLHVASPLGDDPSRDPDALIVPARDGTLRVLRAAVKAGVRRVVMTSAAAAARPPHSAERISDETVWADPADRQFDAYRRSKILAERAAWDFMAEHAGRTSLTTILPGAVFGPVLTKANRGSVQIIQRLLEGRPAAIPRLGFWIVDVRDLAELHVRAMTASEAAANRFIAAGDFMWMEDIATDAATETWQSGQQGADSPVAGPCLPVAVVVRPDAADVCIEFGRKNDLTAVKARRMLGFSPRPATTTIVDCAESLLKENAV